MVVPLGIHPPDAVLGEETHVLADHAEVREGRDIIMEIRHVVPDVDPVADPVPFDYVADEGGVDAAGRVVQRVREAALDRAEANADVRERPRDLRRAPRVLVGEGVDHDVGVVGGDVRRDGVDEAQKRSGLAALLLVDGRAPRAFAVVSVVVLRDRDDLYPGILFQYLPHRGDSLFQHFGVGEAGLLVPGRSVQVPHRVDEPAVADVTALRVGDRPDVDHVLQAPVDVPVAAGPVGLPRLENGGEIKLFADDDVALAVSFKPGHEESHPGKALEEPVDGVDRSASVSAGDPELSAFRGTDGESVVGKGGIDGDTDVGAGLCGDLPGDFLGVDSGQAQVFHQLARRVFFGF